MSIYKHDAIRKVHPEVITIRGEEAWDKDERKVSLDETKIKVEVDKLETSWKSKQYQRDRQPEYPSIPDQLDKIYHSGINEWKKDIKAVKDKYPKP